MKYELTNETKEFGTRTLYRIRALRDIPEHEVVAGDLGGWVESESNLSQDYNAWVSGDACVYDSAWVSDNAQVSGRACVYDNAQVSDNAHVYGDSCVYDNAQVYGSAQVSDRARVSGDARVSGRACVHDNAHVYGNAQVFGSAWVYGDARVYGNAQVFGSAWVYSNARVYGDAYVSGNVRVSGDARVYGNVRVSDRAHISGDARLPSRGSVFTASYVGTANGVLTVTSGVSGLVVTRGCFMGSVGEFLAKSKEFHDDRTHNEYRMLIEVAKSRIPNHEVPDTDAES